MRSRAPAVFLGITLAVASAGAEPEALRRADEAFRTAEQQLALGQFAAAASAYERAAELVPHPAALLDAADAWERASDPARAADDCERALNLLRPSSGSAGGSSDEEYRSHAQACLDRLGPGLAVVELTGPRVSSVQIDARPAISVPTRRRVMPGHHVALGIDAETRRTLSVGFEVAAGETRAVDLTPPDAVEPRGLRDGETTGRRLSTAFWVTGGVAGASAIAGAVSGVLVVRAYHDYNDQPSVEARDRFHRWSAATDIAIGVGALAVVSCVVMWIRAPTRERSQASKHPGSSAISLGGGGLTLVF